MSHLVDLPTADAVGPRHRPAAAVLGICLAAAVLRAGLPWVIHAARHPGEDPTVRVLYCTSIDLQYLPQITAGARLNFGETELYESYGRGLKSYPFASTLPYSLCYALFGTAGFPVLELAVSVLMLLLVAAFLRECGAPPPWNWLGAVLYISNYGEVVRFLGLHGWVVPVPFALWGTRGPRPFVSDLYMVGTLILLVRLFGRDVRATSPAAWAGVGLGLAAMLQCDPFTGFAVGVVAGLVALAKLARPAVGGRPVAAWALRVGLMAAALAAASVPFLVQRWQEHPDIPVRFGAFRYPGRLPPFLGAGDWAGLGVAWLAVGLTVRLRAGSGGPTARGAPWLLGLLCTAAFFTLPAMTVLTGKLIQVNQYVGRFRAVAGLTYLVALVELTRFAAERWARRPGRVALALLLAAAALTVGVAAARGWVKAGYTRSPRLQSPELPHYRRDLDALAKELAGPAYADCRVLGTLQYELDVWWSTFRGNVFVPDAFITNAPDAEVERRYARFFKLVGADEELFLWFLRDPVRLYHWLGTLKHQVTVYYSHAPLDRLPAPPTPAELEAGRYEFPLVQLSVDDERHLRELFRATGPDDDPPLRLDLIVLPNVPEFQALAPPAERFEPVYRNESFRAYRRRAP
jgi:hypothetical protein